MHEESAQANQKSEDPEQTGEPEDELLALRVQLVLSQMEHPSRWGRQDH